MDATHEGRHGAMAAGTITLDGPAVLLGGETHIHAARRLREAHPGIDWRTAGDGPGIALIDDAAHAAHAEKTQGTLEPGKWADFILVDRDIFTVDPGSIWSTQVLETWVGGKRVYSNSP